LVAPLEFGSVSPFRADKVAIIGSGASLIGTPLSSFAIPGVFVIGVNDAARRVPATNAFFTCDPSAANRRLLSHQRPGVTYFAAVPSDYGTPRAKADGHRAPPEPNVTYLLRVSGPVRTGHMPGLSEDPTRIHSGNSAYGALGVAYLMGATRIALFGIDGHGGYAWNNCDLPMDLSHLPAIFETALPQLRKRNMSVVNGSPTSTIRAFPRMTIEEALDWLR
jgi:hypothetical protein